MDEDMKKILKWAGIVALIALPVIVILKKRIAQQSEKSWDDEPNIFASELEE